MRKRVFWIGLIFLFFTTFSFAVWTPSAIALTEAQKIVLQSWRIVNQSYIDDTFNNQNWWFIRQNFLKKPLNDSEEAYSAIEEMLGTLNDPYTRLLRPEQYHSLQISTSGELSGVGIQINIDPESKQLEVVAPLAGSPAAAAGIKPHDRILAIDGVKTLNLTLDEAAAKMRGPVGSKVSLMIQDTSQDKEQTKDSIRTIELIRDHISLNPVYAKLESTDNVKAGYIRLNQFSANATTEVGNAIAQLEKQGANAYILDLRNNPGGLLQAGIEIARLWIDQGTIVYTVNRQGLEGSFDATEAALTKAPLVVLVNQGTASASEILAGALQDQGRAVLIGEKTFGKGLIQSLFELPDGSGMAVTVAKYETPNHRDINKLGIMPDYNVPQEPIFLKQVATEEDAQYQSAIKLLAGKSVLANAG